MNKEVFFHVLVLQCISFGSYKGRPDLQSFLVVFFCVSNKEFGSTFPLLIFYIDPKFYPVNNLVIYCRLNSFQHEKSKSIKNKCVFLLKGITRFAPLLRMGYLLNVIRSDPSFHKDLGIFIIRSSIPQAINHRFPPSSPPPPSPR